MFLKDGGGTIKLSNKLLQVSLPIRETKSCNFTRTSQNQICAGEASTNPNDVKDACRI